MTATNEWQSLPGNDDAMIAVAKGQEKLSPTLSGEASMRHDEAGLKLRSDGSVDCEFYIQRRRERQAELIAAEQKAGRPSLLTGIRTVIAFVLRRSSESQAQAT